MEKLHFASDYMEGAHKEILDALIKTNDESKVGYGEDEYCLKAKELILKHVGSNGSVYFFTGGTQVNQVLIDSILGKSEGILSPDTGHINVHEAGAIEYTGHKIIPIKNINGKISSSQIKAEYDKWKNDLNHDHMVEPRLVYISQPTEYGTLYSKDELIELMKVCEENSLFLYVDGARLAYAFSSKENDIDLKDLGKYTDAFYIGGTKCGALFGEALVINNKDQIKKFVTLIKMHGALLSKGRLLGVQFLKFFEDGLYFNIGKDADKYADIIRNKLKECGFKLYMEGSTNQVFFIISDLKYKELSKYVDVSFMEKYDDESSIIRICASWHTTKGDVDKLLDIIEKIGRD